MSSYGNYLDRLNEPTKKTKKEKEKAYTEYMQSFEKKNKSSNKSQSSSNAAPTKNKTTVTAPVKTTVTAPVKQSNSLWKGGYFDDGYDFGDISKTILATYKHTSSTKKELNQKDNFDKMSQKYSSLLKQNDAKAQQQETFDDKMRQKYSSMSLSEIEKELARVEEEEKKFKKENGGKAANYLAKVGSYFGEGLSGQSLESARTKSDSNIDTINDYTREKEIINIYRKLRATEEYLGSLDDKQLKMLDDIGKAEDLDNAAPFVMATQQDNPMAAYTYAEQTAPEKSKAKSSRESLLEFLRKQNAKMSDEELNELLDNMVELRKNQVNAETQERTEAESREFATEHPVGSFIVSRLSNLYGGFGGLVELYNQRDNEYGIDTNAPGFSLTKTSGVIDEQVQLDHDWEINIDGETVDGFDLFYKVGTGVVDNLSRLAMSGGNTTMAGALMFSQVTTQSVIEGKEKGYSDAKALTLGLLNGTFEAISEKISLDIILKDGGGILRSLAKGFVAEGGEEVTSNWLNRIADEIANGNHSELSKLYESYINQGYTESQAMTMVVGSVIGEDFESFVVAGLSGLAMGGGNAVVNSVANNIQQNEANKLTDIEQQVVDKVVEDRIAEATEDGKTLTKAEEKKIREEVRRALDRGYIDTETIESVLGGEEFGAYKRLLDARTKYEQSINDEIKALQEEHKKLQEEYEELNNLAMTEAKLGDHNRQTEIKARQKEINAKIGEVKAELKELEADTSVSDLKTRFDENFVNVVKGSRLEESYREIDRHNQAFTADINQYESEYAKKTIQNAIAYGMDDTNEAHDFMDLAIKIATDKNVEIVFTTTEGLAKSKKSGNPYNIKADVNKINAFISEEHGKMFINMDTKKSLQSLVGHEITHPHENAKTYDGLHEAVKSYLGETEYKKMLESKTKAYEGLNLTEADIEKEIIADFCGERLFTDYDFVQHLSTENRNIFQKIYDEIKYLCKIATAGSKQLRQLEKVKHQFEKVWRESAKNTDAKGTKMSLSEGVELTAEQETYFKDSKVRDENGNLKVMYHGTSKGGFTSFDTYGSNYGLMGTGSYFTDNKSIAESYTNKGKGNNKQVYEAYLNITNPLDMDAEGNAEEWAKAFPDVDFPESGTNEEFYRAVEEFYSDQMMPKWEAAEEIRDSIQFGMGYDGITHIGGGRVNADGTRHQVYIAFEPEQIKNIDNIAPTKDADIRYSLSDIEDSAELPWENNAKDSEGNKLTQKQIDYFEGSQAVDRNGNLLKVYHTTKNDFTVFDKTRKGEATEDANTYLGFFFSDDAEYMQNFPEFENGKTESYYLNMKNPIDMTDISEEAFLDIVEVMGGDVDEAADVYAQELADEQDRAKLRGDNNVSLTLSNLFNELTGEFYYDDFIRELQPHYDELMSKGYDGVINYMDELFGVKEYIVLDSNQAKLTSNLNPTADADVRYSLSDSEQSNNDVKVLNGSAIAKYSLSTWTPETQTKVRNNLIKAGYDGDQVDKWIKDTNGVASVIAANKDRLDFVAADNQVMLKDNQEYIKTLDASTLCAKRLVYQGTFDAIQHRMPNTMLSSDDLIDLLNMMKEHGVQTPCGVCYVESRRRHLGKFAQDWLNNYNGEYKPNLDEVTTSDGLEALRKSHPQTYKDFVDAMNRKGSSNPKVVQLRTEYRNEIMSLTPSQIRKIEAIGGLRVQSFSDFETPHMLDMMQAVMDMSAKGLHSQAYTKVPNFAWVFGDTGIKINLSLIAEGDGFDSDGNLAFSNIEGIDFDEAMRLRDAYSQNVGTIIVGANDKHILACMADDRIDFIIPFHRSGWGMNELEMMGMTSYTDYTYGQKEHDLNKPTKIVNGVQQYASLENLYPPDYWDYTISGKENAERYLNLCAKTGREPKFSQFLVNNGDGSYSLQPDGSTDGYWKTLIDFKMYDNEGNGAAQQKVQPNFNMAEAYRVLNEYEGGANSLPVANDVVEEFVAKHKNGTLHSLSDGNETFEEYGNFNTYAKDITVPNRSDIAPMQETVSKVETVEDIAPMSTNSEPFTETPIITTKQKISAKLKQSQAELDKNIELHQKSIAYYDEKIAKAQAEYDAKKNKDTKAANNLLRSIERYKRLKGSADADYKKRISDIETRISKLDDQLLSNHDKADRLERYKKRADARLEADKKILSEEIEQRRTELQEELKDKNAYISKKALELYKELNGLRKGVRASEELGYFLDFGFNWSELKSTLLKVSKWSDVVLNPESEVESIVREAIGRDYEERLYELDDIDNEYDRQVKQLEADAKKELDEFKVANQRMTKQQEYTTQMEELVGDTSTWVDKKLGISYGINTLRRNLRDIVRDVNGKKDIAKADAIYDELQGKYNHNEAELNRESNQIKRPFADMKITKAEDAYIQMLGELRHNPETTLTEDVVKEFYENHKKHIDEAKVDKAIEEARTLYDDLLVRVNQELSEQGMKEIPYRKGYFPHFTEEKQGFLAKLFNWKTQNNDIPTDIAGLTENFNPNRSWQSFNKQRKGDTTDYSFLKGLDSYVQGSLDWIYHIEDIQKRRALENHIRYTHSEQGIKDKVDAIRSSEKYDAEEMQDLIDAVYKEAGNPLNNFVTDFRMATNTLAGKKSTLDRSMEALTNRKFYSTMTNLSNRVSANMVAGSVSSALTNFIPITQSWGQVSPISSLRAMGETIRSTFRDDGTINKSDFLTNRLDRAENLYKTNWDKAGETVGYLMESIDSFTSQTVWRSKYNENLSKGMSENEAIKNADQFAENVLAGRSRGNNPTIFDSKNPLIKTLTVFQLEVNNQYGYMFKDMPQDVAKESKAKLAKGYATMFLGAFAYNALYSALVGRDAAFDPIGIIADLLRDLGVLGDDDDEDEEIAPVDVAMNFAENILQEVPFIGGLLGGGRIPLSSALPYDSVTEAFKGTLQDVTDGNVESLTKEWLKPVYYLAMPMGGGQLRKTVQGLSMFSDEHPITGSYTDSGSLRFPVEDTTWNRIQAGLFGQYANKNAQTYFDEGYAPLKEKQIQEYIDSEMPIEDYWKYREGLIGLTKIEEKADYIYSLDLPTDKKNLLINNIADRKEPIDLTDYGKYDSFEEFDYAQQNPEKYAFLENEGIGYLGYKELDAETKEAWSWAFKHQDEYEFYKENGVLPGDYSVYRIPMLDFKDEEDEAYQWAFDYPNKAVFAKAFDGIKEYRGITKELFSIKGDPDGKGGYVYGTQTQNRRDYIASLQGLDEGQKAILYRVNSDSKKDKKKYDRVIVEYLDNRSDISFDEMCTILEELGFEVDRKTRMVNL